MTQKWLIAETDSDTEANLEICAAQGCCGFFRGVPPFLEQRAREEAWVLPCFWTEDLTDPVEISA